MKEKTCREGQEAHEEMPNGKNYGARGKSSSSIANYHRVSSVGTRWNKLSGVVMMDISLFLLFVP